MSQPRSVRRRRKALLLVVAGGLAATATAWPPGGTPDASTVGARATAPTRSLEIRAGDRVILRLRHAVDQPVDRRRLRRLLRNRLPELATATRGRAQLSYRYDAGATLARALAIGAGRTRPVMAVRRLRSSRIRAAVVRQEQRNTCESAALAMLLDASGRRASQTRLQRALPRSGTPDPLQTEAGLVWGDPDRGYVGRPDGGGVAGGFGVYPRPVIQVARRFGLDLEDLTGSAPDRLYQRVLGGRAVMAWIGLSDGPYRSWRSPSGRQVRVNLGEHTVVLTGVETDGSLRILNPLEGTVERWSRARFEAAWHLLGRRAIGA